MFALSSRQSLFDVHAVFVVDDLHFLLQMFILLLLSCLVLTLLLFLCQRQWEKVVAGESSCNRSDRSAQSWYSGNGGFNRRKGPKVETGSQKLVITSRLEQYHLVFNTQTPLEALVFCNSYFADVINRGLVAGRIVSSGNLLLKGGGLVSFCNHKNDWSGASTWVKGWRGRLSAIGYWLPVIDYRLSTTSYRLSAIDYQLLTIGYRPATKITG